MLLFIKAPQTMDNKRWIVKTEKTNRNLDCH